MTALNEITQNKDLNRLQKAQVENLINTFRPLIDSIDLTANAFAGYAPPSLALHAGPAPAFLPLRKSTVGSFPLIEARSTPTYSPP